MLFEPEMIARIEAGKKTTARWPGASLRYERARVYAIQPGGGKRHGGHILLREAHIDERGVTDFRDHMAQSEGFESAEAFLAHWGKLYPKLPPHAPVAVYRFEYLGVFGCCAGTEEGG